METDNANKMSRQNPNFPFFSLTRIRNLHQMSAVHFSFHTNTHTYNTKKGIRFLGSFFVMNILETKLFATLQLKQHTVGRPKFRKVLYYLKRFFPEDISNRKYGFLSFVFFYRKKENSCG